MPEIPSDEGEFLFVGDHPALDFLNTAPITEEGRDEKLESMDALFRWYARVEIVTPEAIANLRDSNFVRDRADEIIQSARDFRAEYRSFVTAWTSVDESEDRSILDDWLRKVRPLLQFSADGHALEPALPPEPEEPKEMIGPVVYHAARLAIDVDRRRISQCDGRDCVLLFVDTTRNRSRRWCRMSKCGNRAKVRRHRNQSES